MAWSDITREERAFCAELECLIRDDINLFIEFVNHEANLSLPLDGNWDSGFEACFYRDYLHYFDPAKKSNFSSKRTFDIALFHDQSIVIIEAKAAEPFSATQAEYFKRDIEDIHKLLGNNISVHLVALATKSYFENYHKFGRGKALEPFENHFLTWEAVALRYPESKLLNRACQVYKSSWQSIVQSDELPSWKLAEDLPSQIKRLESEISQREAVIKELKRKSST
jgi:hypothetical protein